MTTDQHKPPSNTTRSKNSDPSSLADATAQALARRIAPFEVTPERDAEILAERAERETRETQDKRNELFANYLGSRRRYKGCKLENWQFEPEHEWEQRTVVEAVRDFRDHVKEHYAAGTGCLFYGPPGTGKDFLATTICRAACLEHGISCRYLNGVELFVRLRDSMDNDRISEASIVQEFSATGILVLSDPLPPVVKSDRAGANGLSPYQAQMLYRLVDERSVRKLPTIVTVNVQGREDAIERLGGATWDRLRDGAYVFGCNWPSFRKPAYVVGE